MEQILNYLMTELQQSERIANRNAAKLCKYDDIKEEFLAWIDTKDFGNSSLVIDGYNAKKIAELAPFMNGAGVYNFMVTLRENPELAHALIAAGFPRKQMYDTAKFIDDMVSV